MARNFFNKRPPVYLSACLTKDSDRELVRAFGLKCDSLGISRQQGLVLAVRAYLGRES